MQKHLVCTYAHSSASQIIRRNMQWTSKGLHTIIAALSVVASAAVKHAWTKRVSAAGMAPASFDSGFLSCTCQQHQQPQLST